MDPFEYFQQMRPQIERDEVIMRNLREYAFGDRWSLPYLGKGTTNTHYGIGRITNLWLATREAMVFIGLPESQRAICETYLDGLLYTLGQGKEVPIIAGGIMARTKEGKERYFLLLEDLTKGGNGNFYPGGDAEISGMVDGREVFYDFHENDTESFDYMVDGKMIQLVE